MSAPSTKDGDGLPPVPKPPKRNRQLSGFNEFCKDKKKRKGETAKEQFTRFGREWKKVSDEKKAEYAAAAKQKSQDVEEVWSEHMAHACNELKYCDALKNTPSFLVYQDPFTKELEVRGAGIGLEFAQQNAYIVSRFDAFLGELEESADAKAVSETPQQQVRTLFNTLYSNAIGKPGSEMAYKKIERGELAIKIEGLEELGLTFKNPALYGSKQMRTILAAADTLKCILLSEASSPPPRPTPPPPPPPTTESVIILVGEQELQVPGGTTHALMSKTGKIMAGCRREANLKDPKRPELVVISVIASFDNKFVAGKKYCAPEELLRELQPADVQ